MTGNGEARVRLTSDVPVLGDLPWVHRGNGVIVNAKRRVLGAFERPHHAEAVVTIVNAMAALENSHDD